MTQPPRPFQAEGGNARLRADDCIGHGPKSILLWSQMHGDEPTATPALLDLTDFLARKAATPDVSRILSAFTLRMISKCNRYAAMT